LPPSPCSPVWSRLGRRGGLARALDPARQADLWTLHLSYALNAARLPDPWGLAQLGLTSEIAALHLLGIGGVGGMTLAVMSRASLGHTGRALVAPGPSRWPMR
jgi:uncharacterized protein involved in response to NO